MRNFAGKIFWIFIFLLIVTNVYSQQDTTDNDLLIENPLMRQGSVFSPSVYDYDVNFDPVTGNFVITRKIGDLELSKPYLMDFDQYNNYRTNMIIRDIWRENNQKNNADENFLDDFLNTQLNFDVAGMDKIFGTDEITITPTGNIDVSLGLSYYNMQNYSLPKRQRQNLNFDFNQDIQLGVNGKVGDKVNIGLNYNTKSMFDFENRKKFDYNGKEDEIIQKIEAGDVTFPLDNTLIPGSSTLFGIRTDLKFGRLYVSTVLSQQKGETKTIDVQGGAVLNDFAISASDYEADKHFFLSQYFRNNYEQAMKTLPVVTSPVKITRIEVWITNKKSDFDNSRNIVAFMDLGETAGNIYATNVISPNPAENYAGNNANNLYELMTTTYAGIRDIASVSNILSGVSGFEEGTDYIKLESARKLSDNEYTVNTDLGYISLNYKLKPGEVLAVAYEYTVDGKTYQVGEFSNDIDAPNTLILKLLRGPAATPSLPTWKLMMKNIYSLGTYSLSKEDFSLEIFYNNDQLGTKTNYIPEGDIAQQRLLRVFNFDNADAQNNPNPDGFFDFIEGITIDTKNGLIIFPELEPFGSFLEEKIGNPRIADKYVYTELYDSTQYIAQQNAVKNKFYIQGHYKSSGGNEIMLNVLNVPQGSVKVTQGGKELVENVDYTVDYNIGKVTILNEALLRSGTPIKISLESNDLYGLTTKSLWGTHLNYQFSDDFNVGATIMHLSELPVELKTRTGFEPISNTIYGFNTNYSTTVPFLTKLVDALPFIETKVPSKLTFSAEFAQLVPGNPRILKKNFGTDGASFIDDFEQSQTFIDLKAPTAWVLASVPQGQPDLFPEASDGQTRISGYNRAKLAWYDILDDFTNTRSNLRPDYITLDDISNQYVRPIYEKEIFPNKQNPYTVPQKLTVLNLAFYPEERGPYNFDVEGEPGISAGIDDQGHLKDPETRWAGIMRDLYITDFESSNIGFIEFWLLDPFIYDSLSTGGDLYIDLGDISEDILKDSRKSMENAIPYPSDPNLIDTTQWGIVSKKQMTTLNFDNNLAARAVQDVGFDGLGRNDEVRFYNDYLQKIAQLYGVNSTAYTQAALDPSADNFRYFFDDYYDSLKAGVLERYKDYNGVDGNSPASTDNDYTSVKLYPDMEDVNKDNTLDNYEAYYQYHLHLSPDEMVVGENYIVNKIETNAVGLPNGDTEQKATWYQIKIPIHNPDKVIGNVQGFKSIRFIRLFMRGFDRPTILRFAKFSLIRDEWREYQHAITEAGEATVSPQPSGDGSLDISVVSVEESSQKEPVNYIMPPGVTRQQDLFGQQPVKRNEQSMSLKVINLPDGDAKGVYKTVDLDLRKFKFLRMYVHEEALIGEESSLNDYDLSLFVRIGSDFTQNYYEYEIPLKKTPAGHYTSLDEGIDDPDRYIVWPTENELNLELQKLIEVKQQRNVNMNLPGSNISYNTPYIEYDGKNKITVIGNPNLANVKAIMIGIRNPRKENNINYDDDGLPKSAEIWVNEFRLTDFNSNGGWAADARVSTNLADFANVTLSGYMHTPGFGSIEKRVNERYIDQTMEYNLTTQMQFGKFFPKEYRVSLPVYFGISSSISNPEYNPFDPDIKFNTALDALPDSARSELKNAAQTYTQRKSFNITNINIQGKERKKDKKRSLKTPAMPWKLSNFSASLAYNEIYNRTPIIEYNIQQNFMYGLNYNYAPNAKAVVPFKKVKFLNKKAFKIIKDFNFYYLPTRMNFSAEVNRQYTAFKSRVIGDASIDIPASYRKDFLWNRNYDLTYKLTKNLRLDFTAKNAARVEPDGWRETETLFEQWNIRRPQDTIFLNMLDFGRNTDYTQQIKLNYRVPVNKLPLLGWTSLTLNYSANYDWRRGQDAMTIPATDTTPEYSLYFGNMIQNTSTFRADARFNFSKIYKSIKYLRTVDSRFTRNGRKPVKTEDKDVEFSKTVRLRKGAALFVTHNLKTENITDVQLITPEGKNLNAKNYTVLSPNRIKIVPDTSMSDVTVKIKGKKKTHESILLVLSDYTLKSMMMLQNVSVNYKIGGGTLLNGYLPESGEFGMIKTEGMLAPGWNFILGLQDRTVLDKFSANNWITEDTLFNLPINFTNSEELRGRINLEPLNNVKLDLSFQRNITYNETRYGYAENGAFNNLTMLKGGNFFISFNMITSSFEKLDTVNYGSEFYDYFLDIRNDMAFRLADRRSSLDPNYAYTTYTDTLDGRTYPVGYSSTSQQVLLLSFLSAYSGIDPMKIDLSPFLAIPFPDWRLTFDGLSNLPFVKRFAKKISLTHAYSSTYSINDFKSNPNFDYDNFDLFGYSDAMYETNGLFIPEYEINGVFLSEKFVPLIGLDITWKGTLSTRFEYKRSRDMFLSFSNNQIRERHNTTYTVGLGYTVKSLPMMIKVEGKPKKITSDLNLRIDLSGGHDIEIFRKIVEGFSELSSYRNTFNVTFTADYTLSQKLSIQFFFNDAIMDTNTSYRTTNAEGGFKIRFNVTP